MGAEPQLLPERYYRPELDVLRFFAFLLVFLSHVVPGDPAFFAQMHVPAAVSGLIIGMGAGGAFGVDLFFALSSFLITTLLLREHQGYGSIDVRSFYVRRVLRIWPLYFAFLFVVIPLLHVVVRDDDMSLKYIVAFALLSGNWACVAWGWPHSVASPLWSVSIEEQFYLTWPLMVRRWAHHLVAVTLVLLAVSFVTRFYLVYHGAVHPQIWCNTLARLDPIACGALLAVYAQRREVALSTGWRVALVALGVAVLTLVGRYEDFAGAEVLVTFPAVSVACTALILATLNARLPCGRGDRSGGGGPILRVLVYMGRISYGLYVFHPMFVRLFDVVAVSDPGGRFMRTAGALLATVAAAIASYHLLEKPFLRRKAQFARVQSRPA